MYCNLYTLRSESNWGIGNLQDLAVLVDGAAGLGMDFVGLNPLHALANRGPQICPYQPVSRLFSNELYLDIAAIPELVESPAAVRLLASQEFFDRLQEVRCGAQIPYEPIAALVRTALELLFGTFRDRHLGRETPRGCSYGRFIAAHPALQDFAAFQALDEHFRARGVAGGWPAWPAPYRRRDSEEVARFRAQNHERIAFHCYCQFELDRQLSDCAGRARAAGMSIGLYGDLALGTAADGFDTWAWPDLFASGASVGAPPDPLAPTGQNWALPPLQPRRLRDDGYRYWADLLRAAMSWAGAVRIDHVMGLGRQYWIPAGLPGSAGAYVRYPADELFAVLALESHRHRVVVVGEDLGTVEPGFREQLARWGLFSSQVLYLERDPAGEFVPASSFMRRALATVNTHDMVPLAGYLNGDDLALHRELGQYSSAEQEEGARTDRRLALAALQRRLQAEGLLEADAEPTYDQWCCAVHRFLSRTPARLVAVSLDDVAGETAPVNVPGVGPARRINWSRRMGRDVRALLDDPSCRRRLAAAQPAPAESDR
jgi:4-alpha-glucanotransferase